MRALIDALRPYPRTCVWELTARCNLACLHCASNLGPRASRGRELEAARAQELCDELADLGCEYAVLSGGEPLLRADWPDIARRLHQLGVRVGMISNGLRVDERTTETMVRAGLSILAVSVDGPAPVHDAIRRRRGSHAAALAALGRARDAGLRIHAVTHVNRLNRDRLDELHREVVEIGVQTWLVQLSAPWGRLLQHRDLLGTLRVLRGLAGVPRRVQGAFARARARRSADSRRASRGAARLLRGRRAPALGDPKPGAGRHRNRGARVLAGRGAVGRPARGGRGGSRPQRGAQPRLRPRVRIDACLALDAQGGPPRTRLGPHRGVRAGRRRREPSVLPRVPGRDAARGPAPP